MIGNILKNIIVWSNRYDIVVDFFFYEVHWVIFVSSQMYVFYLNKYFTNTVWLHIILSLLSIPNMLHLGLLANTYFLHSALHLGSQENYPVVFLHEIKSGTRPLMQRDNIFFFISIVSILSSFEQQTVYIYTFTNHPAAKLNG